MAPRGGKARAARVRAAASSVDGVLRRSFCADAALRGGGRVALLPRRLACGGTGRHGALPQAGEHWATVYTRVGPPV